ERLASKQRLLDLNHPAQALAQGVHSIDLAQHRLTVAVMQRLDQDTEQMRSKRQLLMSLGPEAVLARGFSMTMDTAGKPITDADAVRPGEKLVTRVAKGKIRSVVAE